MGVSALALSIADRPLTTCCLRLWRNKFALDRVLSMKDTCFPPVDVSPNSAGCAAYASGTVGSKLDDDGTGLGDKALVRILRSDALVAGVRKGDTVGERVAVSGVAGPSINVGVLGVLVTLE